MNAARSNSFVKRRLQPDQLDDLVMLDHVREDRVMAVLKNRYASDLIYTSIGPVLVAINPFKTIPALYTEARIREYRGKKYFEMPPHPYALTDEAFSNIVTYRESQCIIISGESGSGKTETSKFIMQYISSVSGKGAEVQRVKDRMLSSNPILEAFGNAKTINNNNSSRFGKYMEILFDTSGDPVGGRVTNYLLEKSRVIGAAPGERCFHVFYQICGGASPDEKKELYIEDVHYFRYLMRSGCLSVPGINDKADWNEVTRALRIIGISDDERFELLRVISVILWLGQLDFASDDEDCSYPANTDVLAIIAHLLQVQPAVVTQGLCVRTITTGSGSRAETIRSPCRREEAEFSRDTLAKTMYSKLFDWLVARTNESIQPPSFEGAMIGVLDIFGFEIFEVNSFEQLCINFVNERLQQIFIELTLKTEQEEYRSEGIPWTDVAYYNNKPVCDLIEGSPGILSLLDDCCNTHKDESAFSHSVCKYFEKNECFNPGVDHFTIKHYAGDVTYTAGLFVIKNKDTLFDDLVVALQASPCKFVDLHGWRAMDVSLTQKRRPPTVGRVFRDQVKALMTALMSCVPHYIRCIKPNHNKASGSFDNAVVQRQVQYLGLLENVRVRKSGYAYRNTFERFVRRYGIVSEDVISELMSAGGSFGGNDRNRVIRIANSMSWVEGREYAMGKSKIFVREAAVLFHLEDLVERKVSQAVRVIQTAFRVYLQKRRHLVLKSFGFDILKSANKERRRDSMSRDYWGDYIGCQGNRHVDGLLQQNGGGENIIFADRGHMVNVKERKGLIGRVFSLGEDIQEPRIFLVSSKAIYCYALNAEDKSQAAVAKLFFRVTFSQLGSIAISPLADCYMILHFHPATAIKDVLIRLTRKTEFMAAIAHAAGGLRAIRVISTFTDQIVVNAKKGKASHITWERDEMKIQGTDHIIKEKQNFKITCASGVHFDQSPEPYRPPDVDLETGGRVAMRALRDVPGNGVDELAFRTGDIIYVVRDEEKGWYQGELGGAIGWVPANAVELMKTRTAAAAAAAASADGGEPRRALPSKPPPFKQYQSPTPSTFRVPPPILDGSDPVTPVVSSSGATLPGLQSPANYRGVASKADTADASAARAGRPAPAIPLPNAPATGGGGSSAASAASAAATKRWVPVNKATTSASSGSSPGVSSNAAVSHNPMSRAATGLKGVGPASSAGNQLGATKPLWGKAGTAATAASGGQPAATGSSAAPSGSGRVVSGIPSASRSPPLAPPPAVAPQWAAHVDPSSGNTYYENLRTHATQWDKPPGM